MFIKYIKYKTSYIFNRLLKAYFRMLFQTLLLKKESNSWKLYIERLQHPLGIPYAMLNAPRWNTHAFIASAGPVTIKENIILDFTEINTLCTSWTFILYKLPVNTTYKVVSSLDNDTYKHSLNVKQGSYSIVLRCYELRYPVELPGVIIDNGKVIIEKRQILRPVPVYPENIIGRRSRLYSFIHYYLHYTFRNPQASLRKKLDHEYLPVGNPETTFLYGYFEKNKAIHIDIISGSGKFLAFITCYNESSFPVFTSKIPVYGIDIFKTPVFTENGTYLIRLIPLDKNVTSDTLKRNVDVSIVDDTGAITGSKHSIFTKEKVSLNENP